jgi:uncharacterized membrane protein YjjP (DUF1212 family)
MTLPGNGTMKRILSGVLITAIVAIGAALIRDGSRITVLETQMEVIGRALETNRVENRDEHKEIKVMLGEIAKEIRK